MRIPPFAWILAFLLACLPLPAFAQADAFDLRQAQIVNAPNVANWPVTTALTSVSFDGAVTRVDFTKKDGPNRWPDVTPPGWEGPLQYTLWLFVRNGDTWVGSAFIQFWHGRDGSGTAGDPDVPSRYHLNWYYSQRWAPVFGHGPLKPGELIGFMVTSGNQRDNVGPNSVQERSNVVTFAATDNGHYTFGASVPPPPPAVVPPPVVSQPQIPSTQVPALDFSGVFNQIAINHAAEMMVLREIQVEQAQTREDIAQFRAAARSKWLAVVNNPVFKYGMAALSGWVVTKLTPLLKEQ